MDVSRLWFAMRGFSTHIVTSALLKRLALCFVKSATLRTPSTSLLPYTPEFSPLWHDNAVRRSWKFLLFLLLNE